MGPEAALRLVRKTARALGALQADCQAAATAALVAFECGERGQGLPRYLMQLDFDVMAPVGFVVVSRLDISALWRPDPYYCNDASPGGSTCFIGRLLDCDSQASCAPYTSGEPFCPGTVPLASGPSCSPQLNMMTSGFRGTPAGERSM